MAVKKKDHERLDAKHIEQVISMYREAEKACTIKAACDVLNIAANGPRLNKIIDEYLAEKEKRSKLKAANRGKPATDFERQAITNNYLDGDSLQEIAERLYRPVNFVKEVIADIGVPQKATGDAYFASPLLPEACIAETFELGQVVWSTRYNGMAIVLEAHEPGTKMNSNDYYVYRIYVLEQIEQENLFRLDGHWGFHANQAAHDLGSLEHLKAYGIDVYKPYRAAFGKWLNGR